MHPERLPTLPSIIQVLSPCCQVAPGQALSNSPDHTFVSTTTCLSCICSTNLSDSHSVRSVDVPTYQLSAQQQLHLPTSIHSYSSNFANNQIRHPRAGLPEPTRLAGPGHSDDVIGRDVVSRAPLNDELKSPLSLQQVSAYLPSHLESSTFPLSSHGQQRPHGIYQNHHPNQNLHQLQHQHQASLIQRRRRQLVSSGNRSCSRNLLASSGFDLFSPVETNPQPSRLSAFPAIPPLLSAPPLYSPSRRAYDLPTSIMPTTSNPILIAPHPLSLIPSSSAQSTGPVQTVEACDSALSEKRLASLNRYGLQLEFGLGSCPDSRIESSLIPAPGYDLKSRIPPKPNASSGSKLESLHKLNSPDAFKSASQITQNKRLRCYLELPAKVKDPIDCSLPQQSAAEG
ncbi:unnamed protein product [Protopolystoma xenopodis]|uniref:Uncharacterized protein n=1 Tax=Protopolystoma xenopodis TaxID=117903 RepID=A0A448WSF1_9PLAT|nr:unnamed protein product [Protopolystoma xenopodis]